MKQIIFLGGQNYEEAMSFIKMKFSELNLNPDKKTIYMHETCATDTNQVQLVITSVIDTIIQKNLQKAGMMWIKTLDSDFPPFFMSIVMVYFVNK